MKSQAIDELKWILTVDSERQFKKFKNICVLYYKYIYTHPNDKHK